MKWLISSVIFAVPLSVIAAEPPTATKNEISYLIDYLAGSGCRFNRNGKWYEASSAVKHIQRKYEYLLRRDLVPTTEAFIESAASESSRSGKPYLVKCGDEAEVQSAAWFGAALEKFRAEAQERQAVR